MYYKDRSTVLNRIESHRNEAADARDDSIIDAPDFEAATRRALAEHSAACKLSPFERELLLAWAQD